MMDEDDQSKFSFCL